MKQSQKGIYIFTLMGLLLALFLEGLFRYKVDSIFCYVFPSFFCLLYALAYNNKHVLRLLGSSLSVALVFSLLLLSFDVDIAPSNSPDAADLFLVFPVLFYMVHVFHYAYHYDNGWRVCYSSLFSGVWNSIILLILALIFCGLGYFLIVLGAEIFKYLGHNFLWHFYFKDHHRYIIGCVLFFVGLSIGQQNINIICGLRFLLLRVIYYLFPVLALISMICLLLSIGQPMADKHSLINSPEISLNLIILGIIFFNAYFQDGDAETAAPPWLTLFLKFYRMVLLVLILMMAVYFFRTSFHDANFFIYLVVALLYGVTYAITAWLPEAQEKIWIQRSNIGIALFFIASISLLNLPYLFAVFKVGIGAAVLK